MTYAEADAILTQCTTIHNDGRHQSLCGPVEGKMVHVCCDCWNAHVYARREARKAALAQRPNDCMRCGTKPRTYLIGNAKLCGRCKTATQREHNANLAHAGTLAIFAQGLLVNTDTWAYHNA